MNRLKKEDKFLNDDWRVTKAVYKEALRLGIPHHSRLGDKSKEEYVDSDWQSFIYNSVAFLGSKGLSGVGCSGREENRLTPRQFLIKMGGNPNILGDNDRIRGQSLKHYFI